MRCRCVFALLGAFGLFGGLWGCMDKGGPPIDHQYVEKNLLTSEPTPKVKLDAQFGSKVRYLGCDIDKDQVVPGDKVKIIHYWKVEETPGKEWRAFTHLDGPGEKMRNNDATAMRKNHGPERWKTGDIVRDEQDIAIPADWKAPVAEIYVGLFRKGGQSDKDRMPISPAELTDGKSRLRVVRLPVGAAQQKPVEPVAGYVVKRASGAIVVDGKGDDAAWKEAVSTGAFKDAEGQGDKGVGSPTAAKLLWNDEFLYALIEVTDPDIYSEYVKPDDPLWKRDAVELFIDADKSGRGYVELQVNPRNAAFDSWFATNRGGGGDDKWTSGMVTAVTVDGTPDKEGDLDKSWVAEIAIPLAAVKGNDAAMPVGLPPKVGDAWKLNVVRVEGGKKASAWALITLQDFHAIDRLLTVTFGDEAGAITPAVESKVTPPVTPDEKNGAKKTN